MILLTNNKIPKFTENNKDMKLVFQILFFIFLYTVLYTTQGRVIKYADKIKITTIWQEIVFTQKLFSIPILHVIVSDLIKTLKQGKDNTFYFLENIFTFYFCKAMNFLMSILSLSKYLLSIIFKTVHTVRCFKGV